MNAIHLTGRVILVAGAGHGLGRQAAAALGALGAAIAVNDINPDSAAETVRLVGAAGGLAKAHLADVSTKFAVQAMCNAIEDDWGRLDAVVNNARVVPSRNLLEMDEWEWRRTLDVNLTGAFVLAQVAGRLMQAAGSGVLVQLIQTPEDGPGLAAYRAAAAGSGHLIEAAASELSPAIRCQTVHYRPADYEAAVKEIVEIVTGESHV